MNHLSAGSIEISADIFRRYYGTFFRRNYWGLFDFIMTVVQEEQPHNQRDPNDPANLSKLFFPLIIWIR
jgi:hypothetical protein